MGQRVQELAPAEAEKILSTIAPAAKDVVLIGGPAVHFWAQHYMSRSEVLRKDAPYTTKDLDFCGSREQAQACAKLLGAQCREASIDDMTPCTAVISFDGRQIDFLNAPFGVHDARELLERSIPYALGRVMHPIHVLESRTANVAELPNYRGERSLKQLRAAVVCMLEFQRDMLEQVEHDSRPIRPVLKLCERIFDLSKGLRGLTVCREHGIDTFAAVICDDRMPELYRTVRYPQMCAELERARRG